MFEHVPLAPPDAIFGLSEAFRQDSRPHKVNLGAGVYKDEEGRTPVLECVKEAERRILDSETSKSYLPIDGSEDYARAVQELIFGRGHTAVRDGRAVTAHCPGGTGALRIAVELLKLARPGARVWLSDPTWPNHPQICEAAGVEAVTFPYFDAETNGLAFERMTAALSAVEAHDLVLLHGCCHNPSGVDPTAEQWAEIAGLLAERRATALVDFAYQGFAHGLERDARPIRTLCERLDELIVCSSYSKNFGLYNERVGALTVIAASAERAEAVRSQVKRLVRAIYSNPPAHGSAIVTTILADDGLRERWQGELATMRRRIHATRRQLAGDLDARGVSLSPAGNAFIAEQKGMFSFSGLSPAQVARLRERHAVYVVSSGRLNVAGMTTKNLPGLCDAIAEVVRAGE